MAQYRNETYILVDYGLYHICKDLDEVTFSDVYEMRRYLGENSALENKSYLWYCLDSGRESLIDEATGETVFVDKPEFNALLDNVQTYIDNQEDPYYGMTDVQKIEYGKSKIKSHVIGILRLTDHWMTTDTPLDSDAYATLKNYRDELRVFQNRSINTIDSAQNPNYPILMDSDLIQTIREHGTWFYG